MSLNFNQEQSENNEFLLNKNIWNSPLYGIFYKKLPNKIKNKLEKPKHKVGEIVRLSQQEEILVGGSPFWLKQNSLGTIIEIYYHPGYNELIYTVLPDIRDNEEILQYFPNLKNYFKNINESSSNQESVFVDQDGLNFIENIHVQKDRVESLVLKSKNNFDLQGFLYKQNRVGYKVIKLTLNQNQWASDASWF